MSTSASSAWSYVQKLRRGQWGWPTTPPASSPSPSASCPTSARAECLPFSCWPRCVLLDEDTNRWKTLGLRMLECFAGSDFMLVIDQGWCCSCCKRLHSPQVSDAISMLRLRFGEPVRFKFLIGETQVLMLSPQSQSSSLLHLSAPFISKSNLLRSKLKLMQPIALIRKETNRWQNRLAGWSIRKYFSFGASMSQMVGRSGVRRNDE